MAVVVRIDWIHPSCRDLVIEELANEPILQARFVEKMSLQGIKISISDSGGALGDRRLPFMKDPRNWEILRVRCLSIAREDPISDAVDLLTTLYSANLGTSDLDRKNQFARIITEVCEEVCRRWNDSLEPIRVEDLATYCKASTLSTPFSQMPQLHVTWEKLTEQFQRQFDRGEDDYLIDPYYVVEWAKFTDIVHDNEPRFLKAVGFPLKLFPDIKRLLQIIETELEADILLDASAECEGEAERLEQLGEVIDMLDGFYPHALSRALLEGDRSGEDSQASSLKGELSKVSARLRQRVDELREKAAELAPPEPDYDGDRLEDTSDDRFDIDGLFLDL